MHRPQQLANAGTATTAALTATTWVAELNQMAQLCATLVAIVVGCCSAWWYIEKARNARRQRIEAESKDNG